MTLLDEKAASIDRSNGDPGSRGTGPLVGLTLREDGFMVTFTRSTRCGARSSSTSTCGTPASSGATSPARCCAASTCGTEIDAPWLFDGTSFLRVNGVDVTPFVDAELRNRFPGRELRRADDPDGLRTAWATLERSWAALLERAAGMPSGSVDISVAGEWSFARRSAT